MPTPLKEFICLAMYRTSEGWLKQSPCATSGASCAQRSACRNSLTCHFWLRPLRSRSGHWCAPLEGHRWPSTLEETV